MKKIILFSLVLSTFVACNSTSKSDKNETSSTTTQETIVEADSHNAKNSLDYYGIYEGITPCADCEGIKVTVTLNKDETFTIKNVYLKNGKEIQPSEFTGKFTWNDKGSIITLNGVKDVPSYFFVGEGNLTIIDSEGKDINPEMIDNYTLKQIKTF